MHCIAVHLVVLSLPPDLSLSRSVPSSNTFTAARARACARVLALALILAQHSIQLVSYRTHHETPYGSAELPVLHHLRPHVIRNSPRMRGACSAAAPPAPAPAPVRRAAPAMRWVVRVWSHGPSHPGVAGQPAGCNRKQATRLFPTAGDSAALYLQPGLVRRRSQRV